jgi:SAM-dependent methyltransferase
MSKTTFDDLTGLYEAMIDWPKRLANEEPFYRHWLEKTGVRRAVDVACGTGHHAAMLHGWGVAVEGSDISPTMIERAKANFGADDRLRWIVRGFDQPINLDAWNNEPFDAAICMGNSLALAANLETVDLALQRMFAAVRPGGLVIVQVLNLWQYPDGPCDWQKCKLVKYEKQNDDVENDILILKGIHRNASLGFVEFLAASITDGKLLHHESVPFLGLEAAQLESTARRLGAKAVHFFGDYRQNPYRREKSPDLIMVAEK